MKKIITLLILFSSLALCQDCLNIKFTGDTYKYAMIDDILAITFNAEGTEMTVFLQDESSTTEAISSVIEMTCDQGALGGGSPLPVQLVSFSAELNVNPKQVILKWITATEVNNYGFQVERQKLKDKSVTPIEDEGWKALGFVQGSGNSNSSKSYEFIDGNPPIDSLGYRLKQIDTDGNFQYFDKTLFVDLNTITDLNDENLPVKFELQQNYPNPFNPSTMIAYAIPFVDVPSGAEGLNVTLRIFDILGREVATLVNEQQSPGHYKVEFDGSKLVSGVYIYQLTYGDFLSTKKLQMIK